MLSRESRPSAAMRCSRSSGWASQSARRSCARSRSCASAGEPGIGERAPLRLVVGPDRLQIGREKARDFALRARLQETRDAVAPFRRAPRRLAVEIVAPGAGVGVDEAQRRFLAHEQHEEARQHDVLEHVGEIAGVESVAVVHRRRFARRQRSGATAIERELQVCPDTLRQLAKALRSFEGRCARRRVRHASR